MSSPPKKISPLSIPYVTPKEIYAATIVLPLLGILFVALRIRQRFKLGIGIGADDWMIIPALLLTIGTAATLLIGVHDGTIAAPQTLDMSSISPEEEESASTSIVSRRGKMQFVTMIQLTLAYGFLKLSVAFLCRRLFVVRRGLLFDWVCWIIIGITTVWTIGFFLALIFNCGAHVSAAWGSISEINTYCNQGNALDFGFVTSDLITDILVWALPLPMIFGLHMTWAQRFAVAGVMALGAISVIAALIKVVLAYELDSISPSTDVDPGLAFSTLLYWFFIEAGIGVIATCLPMIYHSFEVSETLCRWFVSLRSVIAPSSRQASHQACENRSGGSSASPTNEKAVGVGVSRQLDAMKIEKKSLEDVEAASSLEEAIETTTDVSHRNSAASDMP